jgi:hypothetical protein
LEEVRAVRQLIITIALCIGCITTADAQSTFTERLQISKAGEGKVSVTQDRSIDMLVNGTTTTKQPERNKSEQKPAPTPTSKDKVEVKEKAEPKVAPKGNEAQAAITPDTIDLQKKVMRGMKINGYRVQVFAGGNSRSDRLKAERTGDNIKTLFPNEPIYVHFYSPRWICRMGNYRTYEEAHEMLKKVKQLGYNSAIIVKGKITVQYQ